MANIDPKIPVEYALEQTGGSQTKLANKLFTSKQAVNGWLASSRKILPTVAAYRFERVFGRKVAKRGEAQAEELGL